MAEYDLTRTIIPEQVAAAQYELAKGTNISSQKVEKAVAINEQLQQEAQAVLDVIENPDDAQALLLSTNTDLNTSAHWGKLASDILTGKWGRSTPLASSATPSHAEPLATLHSRAWLVHWSLFVYFNHPAGRTLLHETFLAPAYLNTIQSAAPCVLRYVAVAAVLSRRAQAGNAAAAAPISSRVRHAIREVVKVVQLEEYQYSDPVTMFLKELYAAQRELQLAERVVGNDFFLSEIGEEFLDNARYLISEAYCRIHQRIDIADLSARLNLSPDEGEKWIVNLIRDTRTASDAKIDLEKNVIEIHRPALPIYQSVIEKTRGLSIRTQAVGAALSRTG
ncbi:eukaryotic translation initiation factor 3 subunit 6 [Russula earlei]|uniref:Eukaryotic translation initiation factor 3 subunit 6 n=1 Tax=Russula earlei TaxID=71964 RepID=A0ACC0U0A0_9AGAM|nr:eukaryotic translation initiation factor 3 subunit 6 [Russula earlei]